MDEQKYKILGKLRPSSARPKTIKISEKSLYENLPCIQRNLQNL